MLTLELDPGANRGAVCKCSPKRSQGLIATGLSIDNLTTSWHKFCVCVQRARNYLLLRLVDLGA